ncbi:MAG: hypothetical protein NDI94_06105, partial [Candidatus Woesearchaeota archaeon]|nr:hypothetical protein [Candidatus Woesearchaeota archaeon]
MKITTNTLDEFISNVSQKRIDQLDIYLRFDSTRINTWSPVFMTLNYNAYSNGDMITFGIKEELGEIGDFANNEPINDIILKKNPFENLEPEDFNSFKELNFHQWKRLFEIITTAETISDITGLGFTFKYDKQTNCGSPSNYTYTLDAARIDHIKDVYHSLRGIYYPTERISQVLPILRNAAFIDKPHSVASFALNRGLNAIVQPTWDGAQASSVNLYLYNESESYVIEIPVDQGTRMAAERGLGYYERLAAAGVNVKLAQHMLNDFVTPRYL